MINLSLLRSKGISYIEMYKAEKWGLTKEPELFQRQQEFVQHFTPQIVNDMSLEDYCLGTSSHETFSYLLEYGLKQLGSIKGGYSTKHGIFYKEGDYVKAKTTFDKRFGNSEQEAFEKIRKQISFVIDCANNNDLEHVYKCKLWYLIKYKIFFTYNPKMDIPIFKKAHVEKIYKELELQRDKTYNKEYGIRKAIFDFKNNDPVFSMMTNLEFMSFMYSDYSGLDLKSDNEKSEDNTEEEKTNNSNCSQEGLVSEWENCDSLQLSDVDVDTFEIGSKGEDVVENYLLKNSTMFDIDLGKGIIAICREPNKYKDYHCDFMFLTNKGETKFVEVKATSQNTPKTIHFMMSRYEHDFMVKNMVNYFICYVNNVFNDDLVQVILPQDAIRILKPSKYEAYINVSKVNKF